MPSSPTLGIRRCDFVRCCVVVASGIALGLVGYGVFRTPATSPLSIAAAVTVLRAYAATGLVESGVVFFIYALAGAWLAVARILGPLAASVVALAGGAIGRGVALARPPDTIVADV